MTEKKSAFDMAKAASQAAPLKSNAAADATRVKKLIQIPNIYVDAHKEAKQNGKTSLLFSAFAVEALKEKLEREGML